jgi:PAS domain S-box-containing protein
MATSDGQVEYLNRQGVDYTGLPSTGFGSERWWALVHPGDAARAAADYPSAIKSQTLFESVYRIRRVDGPYRRLLLRSQPTFSDDGTIVRWIGTATDVEDQIESDRLLSEAASLLTALQAAAPIGLGVIGPELDVIQVNDELASVRGRSVAEQLGTPVADALGSLWPQIEPAYARVLATGAPVRNVNVVAMTAADPGQFHEWLTSFYPVELDDGQAAVGVVTVDITERSQADEFRSAVMSQVADGVYTQDVEGRLMYMNRAASRMLGWTEDDLCGRSVHEAIHFQRADGTLVREDDCPIHVEGTHRHVERAVGEAFTRKDGSIFPVSYSSAPLRMGAEVEGVAVVFRDISAPYESSNLIRLQIVDSRVVISDAFRVLLQSQEGIAVIASSTTSADAIVEAERLRPDVILVDLALPDLDGISTARRLKAALPDVSIILMTEAHDERVVEDAIEAGCAGVLDKARAWVELVGAVRAAYHGHTAIPHRVLQRVLPKLRDDRRRELLSFLTDREREVLACISEGLSNQAVAERLGMKANTVRNHVQRILWKLGAHSKLEAVVLAGQSQSEPNE